MVIRSIRNLFQHALDVNLWLRNTPDVEQARPSHCRKCGVSAKARGGKLRLHGHGLRSRTLWGRPDVGSSPVCWEVVLRRYRCTQCEAVVAVGPRGIGAHLRYALGTIAMALFWWGIQHQPSPAVRTRCSPWPIVGLADQARWRSLPRWVSRGAELFGLDADVAPGDRGRSDACRIAYLLIARGPPEGSDLERAFVGAHG